MTNKKVDWEDNIDWGRLFRYLLSKWVYFLVSMFLAFVIANIYLHYQNPIHTVTSSILIKTSNSSIEKNLGGLAISDEDRNLNNQISIIHSFKFVRKTLIELDFGISYHHEGNIRTVELYKDSPFRIAIDSAHVQLVEVPLYVSFKPNNRYRVRTLAPSRSSIYNPNTLKIEGSVNNVQLDFEGEIGKPYIGDYFSFTLYLNTPNISITENEDPPPIVFPFA